MKSRIRLVLAAALVGIGALAPALALTIQPGTYRLEWRIPEANTPPAGYQGASLQIMSDHEAKPFVGLRSTKCYSGTTGSLTILLDESKGTGKGYDTAYIVPKPAGDSTIDLGQATAIPLKRNGEALESDPTNKAEVYLLIGEKGAQVPQKAAASVSVEFHSTQERKEPWVYATVELRGGWHGTVKTDGGDLEVQTIDNNSNGLYDDTLSVRASDNWPTLGDSIRLGTMSEGGDWTSVWLGEASSYDGKLYVIKVSKIGDTVDIQPYKGDVGKIMFQALDGSNKPAKCERVMVFGKYGMFDLPHQNDLTVPVGQYRCLYATVTLANQAQQRGRSAAVTGIAVRPKGSVRVSKGGEAILRVGGPVKLAIEPESKVITLARGQEKHVALAFTAGRDDLGGVMGSRSAQVAIKNSKGKVLMRGEAGFG